MKQAGARIWCKGDLMGRRQDMGWGAGPGEAVSAVITVIKFMSVLQKL